MSDSDSHEQQNAHLNEFGRSLSPEARLKFYGNYLMLGERDALALYLREREFTFKEIAESLGVSVPMASAIHKGARAKISRLASSAEHRLLGRL